MIFAGDGAPDPDLPFASKLFTASPKISLGNKGGNPLSSHETKQRLKQNSWRRSSLGPRFIYIYISVYSVRLPRIATTKFSVVVYDPRCRRPSFFPSIMRFLLLTSFPLSLRCPISNPFAYGLCGIITVLCRACS